jgi:hypothetical protein
MSRGRKELLDRRAPQGRKARRDQLDRKVKTVRRGLREHRGQPDHKAGRAKKAMQGRRDRRVRRFLPVPQVLRASPGRRGALVRDEQNLTQYWGFETQEQEQISRQALGLRKNSSF